MPATPRLATLQTSGATTSTQPSRPDLPQAMHAVVRHRYGAPSTLACVSQPLPAPAGGVLVRVRAAAVTQADWHLITGRPYLVRLAGFGLRRPKQPVPGQHFAGTVVAVDDPDTGLRPGDEVFGSCSGAFAEYARADAAQLARRPCDVDCSTAALLPHGGLTALQALRDAGALQPGQRVLVVGAAGAVGSQAVQIARALGAEVTAQGLERHRERLNALAPHHLFIAPADDFATRSERYDLIIDTVRDRPDAAYRRALVRGGRTVMVSGGRGAWFGGMLGVLRAALLSRFSDRKLVPFLTKENPEDLAILAAMVEAGSLRPTAGDKVPLAETANAVERLAARRAHGVQVVRP